MIAIAYYLLKMFLCSGLLFLYYHLALRNKIFHQWNRFYLLASIIISITVPFLQFNIWPVDDATSDIKLLQVVYSADEYVAKASADRTNLSLDQWISIFYSLISVSGLVIFILALIKIYSIIRSNPVMSIEDIKFVNTEEKSAPFSFLKYVFWNKQIDLESTSGKHIFQHELVHVREKHSFDKLFLQLVLIVFWCNPIFWLIRRELRMIHEFIADKKSLGQSDAHAFATMILQAAYPSNYTQLTNQFFHPSIKRRLTMLTKNHNPKITYLNRILALPLMAFIILAFAFKQKNNTAKPDPRTANSSFIDDMLLQKPGESIIEEKDFQKIFNNTAKDFVKTDATVKGSKIIKDTSIKNPLIIVDGKESGRLNASTIETIVSPERIKSMNVLKGEMAIAKYGEKGKDGVIEIITKSTTSKDGIIEIKPTTTPETVKTVNGIEVSKKPTPLYIIDGKESKEINDLSPNEIEIINVLKGISAIDKYGEKARDGVIEIITKASDKNNRIEIKEVVPNKIFEKVEKEPEFPGGIEAWRRYLDRNLKAKAPAEAGAPSGTYAVEVTFIVNLDGSISDIKALTNYGYGMEDEVIRLIKRGPKWISAEQNDHKVVSRRKQIVTFVVSVQ